MVETAKGGGLIGRRSKEVEVLQDICEEEAKIAIPELTFPD